MQKFIVAEITKNWTNETPVSDLLSQQFEMVINTNYERGYKLIEWKASSAYYNEVLTETIIAIFEIHNRESVPPYKDEEKTMSKELWNWIRAQAGLLCLKECNGETKYQRMFEDFATALYAHINHPYKEEGKKNYKPEMDINAYKAGGDWGKEKPYKEEVDKEPEGISNLDQTFGELVLNSMRDLGLHKDLVSEKIGFPNGTMDAIVSDKIYTNCIPIRLTEKLLKLLCITFEEVVPAIKNTYNLLKRNESPDRWKEVPYATLWENTEALGKYMKRLSELLNESETNFLESKKEADKEDELWDEVMQEMGFYSSQLDNIKSKFHLTRKI